MREISAPASSAEASAIFDDLRDTLHEFQRTHGFGRGISAVQIGELKRLIYIEIGGRAYALRNPVYEFQSERQIRDVGRLLLVSRSAGVARTASNGAHPLRR